jgi:hypothetical protein
MTISRPPRNYRGTFVVIPPRPAELQSTDHPILRVEFNTVRDHCNVDLLYMGIKG